MNVWINKDGDDIRMKVRIDRGYVVWTSDGMFYWCLCDWNLRLAPPEFHYWMVLE